MLNLTGQTVWAGPVQNGQQQVDVSGLPRGLYLIEVRDGNKLGRQKLMVQ